MAKDQKQGEKAGRKEGRKKAGVSVRWPSRRKVERAFSKEVVSYQPLTFYLPVHFLQTYPFDGR